MEAFQGAVAVLGTPIGLVIVAIVIIRDLRESRRTGGSKDVRHSGGRAHKGRTANSRSRPAPSRGRQAPKVRTKAGKHGAKISLPEHLEEIAKEQEQRGNKKRGPGLSSTDIALITTLDTD